LFNKFIRTVSTYRLFFYTFVYEISFAVRKRGLFHLFKNFIHNEKVLKFAVLRGATKKLELEICL